MVYRRLVVPALCFSVSVAVAADPAVPEFPRVRYTPAEKAPGTFRTLGGFRMELLAAEPLLTDPVALAYDENGRAYVAEMSDYPYTDAATHQAWTDNTTDAPIGRIRLLVDDDGDGAFDRSSLFAEGLSWPTGVACWKGGVFVAATPDVWFLKDTNGDGTADVRRKVYTGFRKFNVQAVMNNLAWGLDNCIYGAGGSNGGKVVPAENPNARPVPLTRNDFRFDPVTERFEAIPGGARFGNAFDDWGNRFVCNIRNPAQHVLVETRYLKRNPHLPVASVVHDVAASGDALPVYRVSPLEGWRDLRANRLAAERSTQPRSELVGGGVVTSASGITIYRGDAYPSEFRGQLFIGEVANNLVHRQAVAPAGVTFASRRLDEKVEFVASSDVWFRPVNFVNAPDGTLHVLDMYREVIEHPWSIPDDIRAKLDLRSGSDRGRIYRLAPPGFQPRNPPKLGAATTGELVETLRNPSAWWRETSQRLLFERQDRAAVEPLRKLLSDAPEPLARLHALWTLEGLGAAGDADVLRAMSDAMPGVREHGVRVAERRLKRSPALLDRLLDLADDDDLRVRFQTALTLGESADTRVVDALAILARRDAADRWMSVAILSASAGRSVELLTRLARDDAFAGSEHGSAFVRKLATSIGAGNDPAGVARAMALLAAHDAAAPGIATGMGEGLRRNRRSLRDAATEPAVAAAVERLFAGAAHTAADPQASASDRALAIERLAYEEFRRVQPLLTELLAPRQPPEVQRAVVAALATTPSAEVAPLLLSRWASYTPALRSDVMQALLAYQDRLPALFDAIEARRVSVGDVPASRRAATTRHADAQIRARALQVFGSDVQPGRKEVIERFTPALELTGDPSAGRKVYETLCASCHRLGDKGVDVGPNLATVRQWSPQQLLVNILDPHREVAPSYAEYVVQLTDGQTLSGIVAEETESSITLRMAGGAHRVLLRESVKLINGSRLSLMPEGLEAGLTPQQMADLIALLRSVTDVAMPAAAPQ